ncbi:permease prefix domain 1-containing protein [Desulfosporosinus youngiae]|uniref:permease prefix domain 1-containing protein n=1 Tax=Desulfosporosinus youngiae TaxID=339862 RepID=UPI001FA7E8C5|nr:permease prefix domain 1-containing protein [Desulfosporosinus youngiae]
MRVLQPSKITEYLEVVCRQIRWKKAQSSVLEEIENHIIDQKNAFISDGLNEEEATDKAIAEMGDPIVVGEQLDRVHRPGLIGMSIGILLVLGILGTADMGNSLLRLLGVGDQIVLGINIPMLGELIYLVGVFVTISSFAAIFAPRNISKVIIWCQGFILTAIYFMEVFPRIRFALLLVVVNIISFLVVYRISRSVKTGLMSTITSFAGLFLFVVGTQINCYMYNHGVNGSYGGFENVPKALAIICIMCLVPQLLMAAFISAKNSKERIA